jgi:hypothetical protein
VAGGCPDIAGLGIGIARRGSRGGQLRERLHPSPAEGGIRRPAALTLPFLRRRDQCAREHPRPELRVSRWALPALFVFTTFDLGVYGVGFSVWNRTDSLAEFIHQTDAPSEIAGDTISPTNSTSNRVALDLASGTETAPGQNGLRVGNRMLLSGWQRVDGYAGLEPARQLDYRNLAALNVAGATWISAIAQSELSRGNSATTDGKNQPWSRLPDFQPRGRMVSTAIVSFDPAADINQIDLSNACRFSHC